MTAVSGAPADGVRAADQDLRALFGRAPAFFAELTGPAHRVEQAGPGFFDAFDAEADRPGQPLAELLGDGGHELIALLDRVFHTGAVETGPGVRLVAGAGAHARTKYFDLTCEPRRDGTHQVIGVRVVGVETTQIRQAQRLLAEQRALVEQIARQAPLAEVLDGMARCIEELSAERVLVSVLLADPDGAHLRHGAAPSLPEFYNAAIDGIATGEGVGSCGTAAYRRAPVIVTDIGTDPFWDDFRELAEQAGLAACWSTPILARDGSLLGTFAMYHPTPRAPQESDLALAGVFADTAGLAIERHHIEQAKAAAEARAEAALAAEQRLRAEAEQRAEAAAELAARVRAAAAAQAAAPHPERCQLGGAASCSAPAEIKVADSWGDSAWGCLDHVEEVIYTVRSVFIANEELGGLGAYLGR
ncbi:GAF domain-containing protein [Nocardia yunnanensis]|uniref:GAF domain-containing protein n=1 Tax=Nocardia yunnanensis TaxID=2382165 RepID=A0A386ZID5_9NOCA|nr:GAF domain-containing protein [Nocardia yunnanensis]AYF76894.1 GAF domain-containing protein [Nocardia yunnanensis]